MINAQSFLWILYITYYTIDPRTEKKLSQVKTARFILDTKEDCQTKLREYQINSRRILGYTILDPMFNLDRYLTSV